ncbi:MULTISPECIES: VOC family protein [Edwardsiella]|uniref:Biphenyl-2,3-diol 1,2-dioxygenase III-related protein n=2 Tax=Edwardsiella anguillarum TaxID=1821960 RepID=A0A076LSX1_9GAMM|nr:MULTISPECIES: VOC family protein [Edwardsiella]AKM48275.1 virulence protein [Edwardsiella sp. EA181011]GAJ66526.1 glyoxalase family protein [Edwardsiella piscicida]AIJ09618.1 biphenyl-2,3-diol 1,2-dioxygenase III-related protein [Edwardsiella anguillarum ET080813]AKR77373.1 VOC family protein [Edwardsiella sp. LADL05-105]KAB0592591.1 VOC family protein [Edwardsiella anguillarum]
MLITGIDHVVITVQDVEKTLAFYVAGLGMSLDSRNGRLALTFGNQKINIHRQKAEFTPAAQNVTYGSMDICFTAEGDIEQIKAELESRGLVIELGVVPRTGAQGPIDSLYLRDPDGNLVEISVYK